VKLLIFQHASLSEFRAMRNVCAEKHSKTAFTKTTRWKDSVVNRLLQKVPSKHNHS